MLRLSLLAAIVAAAAAFTGPMTLRTGVTGVSMQLDRRAAAQGIAAGILAIPAASFAASGDFPKQSYFGDAPLSAPFGDTYGTAGAPIWEKLGETERDIFTRIAATTKNSLRATSDLIDQSAWEASRQELRLVMGETRKSMIRLNEAVGSKQAKDLYAAFKKKVEALDRALIAKDKAESIRLAADVKSAFNVWSGEVGIY